VGGAFDNFNIDNNSNVVDENELLKGDKAQVPLNL
jgi:hypothetical protein